MEIWWFIMVHHGVSVLSYLSIIYPCILLLDILHSKTYRFENQSSANHKVVFIASQARWTASTAENIECHGALAIPLPFPTEPTSDMSCDGEESQLSCGSGHDYTGWRMCLVNAPEDVTKSTGRHTEWVARQSYAEFLVSNFWAYGCLWLLVGAFLFLALP